MTRLIGDATADMLARVKLPDTLALVVPPGDDAWVARQGIAGALRKRGVAVFERADSQAVRYRLEIEGLTLNVRYLSQYREGLFGARKVVRRVTAGCSSLLTNTATHEVLSSGVLAREAVDTVAADEIPALETAGLPRSRAEVPPEQFIDRVVEPFVIIGATGLVVFLFFHIRS